MKKDIILHAAEIELILNRLTAQLLEKHPDPRGFRFVGIQRRGSDIARRLANKIGEQTNVSPECGDLDINLYRDDWTQMTKGAPSVGISSIPFSIDDQVIVLVDDVLFSGRTIRSAISALLDYGRPKKVELLVLIDRGHRELPICPDFTGRRIDTLKNDQVSVFLRDRDPEEMVLIEHARI